MKKLLSFIMAAATAVTSLTFAAIPPVTAESAPEESDIIAEQSAETQKSKFEEKFFPNGVPAPSAGVAGVNKMEINNSLKSEDLTIIVEKPKELIDLFYEADKLKWKGESLEDYWEAQGTPGGVKVRYQMDYQINDYGWNYSSDWDKIDFEENTWNIVDIDNSDSLIFNRIFPYDRSANEALKEALYVIGSYGDYGFDNNYTLHFRGRFAVCYDTDKYIYSDWSDEWSFTRSDESPKREYPNNLQPPVITEVIPETREKRHYVLH